MRLFECQDTHRSFEEKIVQGVPCCFWSSAFRVRDIPVENAVWERRLSLANTQETPVGDTGNKVEIAVRKGGLTRRHKAAKVETAGSCFALPFAKLRVPLVNFLLPIASQINVVSEAGVFHDDTVALAGVFA